MKSITRSTIRGSVSAPASKSMMGRAVAAALLADGISVIRNPSSCDDARSALDIIRALGAVMSEGEKVAIRGTGKRLLYPTKGSLDCRESGLCMRMFTPIAALLDREVALSASGSLCSRPMGMVEGLGALGVVCSTDRGHAPIIVRGPMEGGDITVDASVSSQFLTGLLIALPLCEADSRISVTGLKSTPYVRMTLSLLEKFGVTITHDEGLTEFVVKGGQEYQPATYTVEGDWSGAAFLLVAGALAGSVTVTGLDLASAQADRAIVEVLEMAGATLRTGTDCVTVEKGELKAFHFDATDCPDLFPPLVALASGCVGKSEIVGLERLAHKESDRAKALSSEFGKLGISVRQHGSTMEVRGGAVHEGEVNAHNDHRIAMACAVAALRAEGCVAITGETCVTKSYPDFFSDLAALGVKC
jgi:3-phosphoshikimate 1-carboxyvinyltransferase